MERAWVLVKRAVGPSSWYDPKNPLYIPGMNFEFDVCGKTPAKIIDARFQLRPVPAKPGIKPLAPDLPVPPDYGNPAPDRDIPDMGMTLPPGKTFMISLTFRITEDLWNQLMNDEMVICAYGIIRYKDAFGRDRETRTCYVYDFAWGVEVTDTNFKPINPPRFRVGGPSEYNQET